MVESTSKKHKVSNKIIDRSEEGKERVLSSVVEKFASGFLLQFTSDSRASIII